jgi:hypothetical protein
MKKRLDFLARQWALQRAVEFRKVTASELQEQFGISYLSAAAKLQSMRSAGYLQVDRENSHFNILTDYGREYLRNATGDRGPKRFDATSLCEAFGIRPVVVVGSGRVYHLLSEPQGSIAGPARVAGTFKMEWGK